MDNVIEDGALVLSEPFYAPSTEGALDHLFSMRDGVKQRIEAIAGFMDGEARQALHYCVEGSKEERDRSSVTVEALLNVEAAVKALDADYWNRAMDLTDVRECMPQQRRTDWYELIRTRATPEFTPENVIPTFQDLLSSRSKFFAERVDGMFRSLSHSHVTNQPEGFGKRMILQYVVSEGGYADHTRAGYINDLRCVIAKFMGRDEPNYNQSANVIKVAAADPGKWITLDGGALRLRVYLGTRTGHLEVHPDMAWRLNAVLASLYPSAIPSQFREPPKRKVRDFDLMQKPLPFAVLELLRSLTGKECHLELRYGAGPDKAQRKRLGEVLAAIGGVESESGWEFDYKPNDVIDLIACSGCIPDAMSHQFYPTPDHIAAAAVEAAGICPGHSCLEPSAGLGGIADLLPVGLTQCVEVSAIHCGVLRAKGHEVAEADFLKWRGGPFDRVVMNPPYSEGRWRAHVEHAASMVKAGGRLVAILPESARGKRLLPGWAESWGEIYKFPGTSISVSIVTAVKP